MAARGVAVTGGQHVGGSRNIRVGEPVPRLNIRHGDETRHVKQAFKRTRSLMLLKNFLIRALANPPVLEGLDWYRCMGEGGVLPLLLHRFHIEHRVKMLRNLVLRPPNIFHPPPDGLAGLREKNIAVDCVAEAVHEVTRHRGGWAVSHHGGVGGGIRGGVLQGCPVQGGLGRNEGGGGVRDSPIPTEPLHPMESGQNDIGDVVERGHDRVAGQDAHIVPPLGLHCLPFKRKVTVVNLRLTGKKVVIDGNHVHPLGAVNEVSGGVDGTEARLGFAHGVHGHDCQKAVQG